jgi:hypothetical protein
VSTILKALRRVEEERPATSSAPRRAMRGDFVAGPDAPPPPRRKRREPNWKLWGSLGAVVLLAALVWWRMPRADEVVRSEPAVQPGATRGEARPGPPAPAQRSARAAPPPPAAPAPTPAPAAAPPAPAATAVAASGVPSEVVEQLPPLGAALEAEAAPPAVATVPPAVATVPPAAAIVSPGPSSEPPAAKPPAAAAAARVAAREPAPKPKPAPAAAAAPVSRAAPQPAPTRAPSAPAIQVDRTSWHPKPERRIAWVRVEGLGAVRELHEGDAVGTLVVKEIRPSSVLFQHGAEQIQRRVGEP